MTTEAYIRDPRFEVHGMGVRFANGDLKWFEDPAEFFSDEVDFAILAHHAHFEGLILWHHFGIRPKLWLDTLSMARMVIGNHLSVSLDSLAKHFDLEAKNVPYNLFKGKHWHEIPLAEQEQIARGCLHDVDLTWQIFQILLKEFPTEELKVVDMTVRMFAEPVLQGNIPLLGKVWMDEETRKAGQLDALGLEGADLQSAETFASLLRAEGVEPQTKNGKNGPIYAFAKTDDFMKELIEDDGRAGALCRARLGVRSTIDQTRAERLGWMARRGELPVYLRYCGAHTTRWSGGDSLNWQNFRRGSDIRRAIEPPQNHSLIILDLAQIECRMLNVLAGEEDVVDAFRNGKDLYSEGASRFYGRTITRADASERHLGKVLELGCGYGMGAAKLRATCKAGALGGPPILLSDDQSESAIATYRGSHPNVVGYWGDAGRIIARIAGGPEVAWGPLTIRDHRVFAPNGAFINYETLHYHRKEGEDDPWEDGWRIRTRNGFARLYGGKLVENFVQFLSRIVLSQAMLRMARLGARIVNCTHDEVLIVVPDGKAAEMFALCQAEMEKPPEWLPSLPLKVEGGISKRYDK